MSLTSFRLKELIVFVDDLWIISLLFFSDSEISILSSSFSIISLLLKKYEKTDLTPPIIVPLCFLVGLDCEDLEAK